MKKLIIICLFGVSFAMSPKTAEASLTVFDTFGPGDSYDTEYKYGTDGNLGFQAFQFVPTASGFLDTVTVALGRSGTAPTETQFDLYAGTSTTLGTLLESIIVSNTTPGSVVSFSSLIKPQLEAGQYYWLSYTEPGAPDGISSLWFFSLGYWGTRITSCLPAHDAALPAFRIEVNQVVPSLSGWVFMPQDVPDIGYSLDEGDLLYFYSSVPVLNYNFTTGQWDTVGPKGLVYANWPFIYELDPGHLWFALPPESGLWVYHFSTGQWEVLPRIIP